MAPAVVLYLAASECRVLEDALADVAARLACHGAILAVRDAGLPVSDESGQDGWLDLRAGRRDATAEETTTAVAEAAAAFLADPRLVVVPDFDRVAGADIVLPGPAARDPTSPGEPRLSAGLYLACASALAIAEAPPSGPHLTVGLAMRESRARKFEALGALPLLWGTLGRTEGRLEGEGGTASTEGPPQPPSPKVRYVPLSLAELGSKAARSLPAGTLPGGIHLNALLVKPSDYFLARPGSLDGRPGVLDPELSHAIDRLEAAGVAVLEPPGRSRALADRRTSSEAASAAVREALGGQAPSRLDRSSASSEPCAGRGPTPNGSAGGRGPTPNGSAAGRGPTPNGSAGGREPAPNGSAGGNRSTPNDLAGGRGPTSNGSANGGDHASAVIAAREATVHVPAFRVAQTPAELASAVLALGAGSAVVVKALAAAGTRCSHTAHVVRGDLEGAEAARRAAAGSGASRAFAEAGTETRAEAGTEAGVQSGTEAGAEASHPSRPPVPAVPLPAFVQPLVSHDGWVYKVGVVAGNVHVRAGCSATAGFSRNEGSEGSRRGRAGEPLIALLEGSSSSQAVSTSEAGFPPGLEAVASAISRALERTLGLRLLGFDLLRDPALGNFHLVDVNHLPSFGTWAGLGSALREAVVAAVRAAGARRAEAEAGTGVRPPLGGGTPAPVL